MAVVSGSGWVVGFVVGFVVWVVVSVSVWVVGFVVGFVTSGSVCVVGFVVGFVTSGSVCVVGFVVSGSGWVVGFVVGFVVWVVVSGSGWVVGFVVGFVVGVVLTGSVCFTMGVVVAGSVVSWFLLDGLSLLFSFSSFSSFFEDRSLNNSISLVVNSIILLSFPKIIVLFGRLNAFPFPIYLSIVWLRIVTLIFNSAEYLWIIATSISFLMLSNWFNSLFVFEILNGSFINTSKALAWSITQDCPMISLNPQTSTHSLVATT